MNVPERTLSLQELFGTVPIQPYQSANRLYKVYQSPAQNYHIGGKISMPEVTKITVPSVSVPAIQNTSPNPVVTISSNPNKKIIICSSIALVIVVAGVLIYKHIQKQKEHEK